MLIDELESSLSASLRAYLGSSITQLRDLLREFHNIKKKKVTQIPRKVFWSKEVKNHPLYKNEKKEVIDVIAEKIKAGQPLDLYLSDKADQLAHIDYALAHFNVHHLHLGEKIETNGARKGRVKGTRSLLFVLFTEDSAYLLAILNHSNEAGFLNVEQIRIMHRNWPHLMEPFKIIRQGVLARTIRDNEYSELLSKNVNTLIALAPGEIYSFPGGGTTTAGTPVMLEMGIDDFMRQMRNLTIILKSNKKELKREIKLKSGVAYNVIRLRARVRDNVIDIYDANSKCRFIPWENNSLVVVSENEI